MHFRGLPMKHFYYIPIVLILLVMVPLFAFSGRNTPVSCNAEQKIAQSYYEQLKSLLTRKALKVRPKASKRDVNLIEAEKGAAGVLFGESMDDVIAVWGKPCGIFINGNMVVWDLSIGACRFGFVDNRLVSISVHSATLKKAYLKNGISFTSSYDEVKSAFGEQMEATYSHLEFATENGYTIRLHFVPDASSKGERKLICIAVYHPDSGK